MSKSTVTVKSVANGKIYKMPSELYDIMMNERYDPAQKAFMFMNWYKQNEAGQFALGDKHIESMVFNLFKSLLPSRQEYRNFMRMYEKRYGNVMKFDDWEEEYKDEDVLKQMMTKIVRKSMEDGKNSKEIHSIVEERMAKYGTNEVIRKMLKDPEVIKELIIKRQEDIQKMEKMKPTVEEDGTLIYPVHSDRKGKKTKVV